MKLIFLVVIIVSSVSGGSLGERKNGTAEISTGEQGNISVPFIIGGTRVTNKTEFPWLVRLNISPGYLCGGSLIKMDLVLTAAHCVEDAKGRDVTVIAGDLDRQLPENTEQTLRGRKVTIHKSYNSKSFVNDIALVKLKKSFTASPVVGTIGLSKNFNGSHASFATVAGWGTTKEHGAASRYLMKVNVPIVNDPVCSLQKITNRKLQFCAGQAGKDSCQGDSGGPLICSNSPGNICGIVSYGVDGCGRAGIPGVYTHVPSYIDWIEANVGSFNAGLPNVILIITGIVTLVKLSIN